MPRTRPVPASPAAAPAADGTVLVEVQWDPGEAPATPDGAPLADWLEKGFVETVEDRRDWLAGHHIGASTVWLGRMRVPARPRAGTDPTAPAGRTNRETRHVAR